MQPHENEVSYSVLKDGMQKANVKNQSMNYRNNKKSENLLNCRRIWWYLLLGKRIFGNSKDRPENVFRENHRPFFKRWRLFKPVVKFGIKTKCILGN